MGYCQNDAVVIHNVNTREEKMATQGWTDKAQVSKFEQNRHYINVIIIISSIRIIDLSIYLFTYIYTYISKPISVYLYTCIGR